MTDDYGKEYYKKNTEKYIENSRIKNDKKYPKKSKEDFENDMNKLREQKLTEKDILKFYLNPYFGVLRILAEEPYGKTHAYIALCARHDGIRKNNGLKTNDFIMELKCVCRDGMAYCEKRGEKNIYFINEKGSDIIREIDYIMAEKNYKMPISL